MVFTSPVPIRSYKGQTYRDVQDSLREIFPAEAYETKKLGFSKELGCQVYWAYIPHWRVRDRLRMIVGGDGYRFTVVGQGEASNGDPVTTGILNILGVEHEGIGYGRSDSGYKGGKEEIAYANSFKAAAEMHGLGVCDDQLNIVFHLLTSRNQNAHNKGKLLITQFEKTRKVSPDEVASWIQFSKENERQEDTRDREAQRADRTTSPINTPVLIEAALIPTVEVSSTASETKPSLYPEHNSRIKKLRSLLNLSSDEILQLTGNLRPSQLDPVAFSGLVKDAICKWASNQRIAASGLAIAEKELERQLQQKGGSFDVYFQWAKDLSENKIPLFEEV